MTRTSPPQVAFSAGEIDPLLHRRFDYQRYRTGLAACNGFLPLPQGGITRAPGTLFRGSLRGTGPGILVPFQFAADDALVLEFTDLAMRVWRYGAPVMDGPDPYELATPWPADALPRLQWVQSADVIYLTDGLRPVQRLARLALDNWTIGAAAFDRGPFRVQNLDAGLTVQASAATGTVTLTASAALFDASHVGSLFRLTPGDQTTIALWTSNEALAVGDIRRYGENVYELIAGTNAGENPPVHEEGEALVDNAPTRWLFLNDASGILRITAVATPTSATAMVLKRLPRQVVDAPTYRWAEGAWSARHGWPATLEIHDQRLCAAATAAEPRTVWFSAVGDFLDHEPGTEADSAFAYSIAGDGSVNRVQNLRRGRTGLHILALGEEYSTRTDSPRQAIGPTSFGFGLDSGIGSSPARPIAPDGNPIFISRDGTRVYRIAYSLQADANDTLDLSLPSRHLGRARFVQIVWQATPQRTAWLRRADGTLAAMIYDPAEEILGWSPLSVAGGLVEHMAVSPSADGARDILTLIVRRETPDGPRRFVEELAPVFGLEQDDAAAIDACHLFAAVQLAPDPPAATLALPPALAGQEVTAWTDLGTLGPLTVGGGGALDLPEPVARATVGLFDDAHAAETLDLVAQAPDGSTIGRLKRLHSRFGVGLYRSAAGWIETVERGPGPQVRRGQRAALVPRPVAATPDTLFSGIAVIDSTSGQALEQALRITPEGGAPLTLTALVPHVQEAGR
ncbi:MAG TPA: hypothetical protein PKD10_05170 [Paracoccaceae bacterium]|nr:hypothetical protein [Paracoccaceae bacterium]